MLTPLTQRGRCAVAGVVLLLAVQALFALGVGPSYFAAVEYWTQGPYYGERGTYFADVTGDRRADAIVVNNNTVVVRRSDGSRFTENEDWTQGPYYGSRGTYFADVTGDRKADAIVVNDNTTTVRRAAVTCFILCWDWRFDPNENWTHGAYYGTVGTWFADVDGDGRADAIVANEGEIVVRRSRGNDFGPNEVWAQGPLQAPYGDHATYGMYMFDINGDNKADVVFVNSPGTFGNPDGSVIVRLSNGRSFDAGKNMLRSGTGPAVMEGTHLIAFAMSESYGANLPLMIDVMDTTVGVRKAVPSDPNVLPRRINILDFASDWTNGPFEGTHGTYFADVTGDERADAIKITDNNVIVRRASPESL